MRFYFVRFYFIRFIWSYLIWFCWLMLLFVVIWLHFLDFYQYLFNLYHHPSPPLQKKPKNLRSLHDSILINQHNHQNTIKKSSNGLKQLNLSSHLLYKILGIKTLPNFLSNDLNPLNNLIFIAISITKFIHYFFNLINWIIK